MNLPHTLLAILVAISWGLNFVMSKICLTTISPLLLATARFVFASLPAIFFIKRPAVPFSAIMRYGIMMFAIPTIFMFCGIHAGVTAGIASLLIQLQSLLTVILGILFFHEKINHGQMTGILFAVLGLGVIAMHLDGSVTWYGCLLLIAAASSLALGNVISKRLGNVNKLALVVWGSFFTWPIILCVALFFEGQARMLNNINMLTITPVLGLLIIAYFGTLFGFGAWSYLLHHHPISSVAPFTLLVPVVGFLGSMVLLNEQLYMWKIGALLLVGAGLAINIISTHYKKKSIQGRLDD